MGEFFGAILCVGCNYRYPEYGFGKGIINLPGDFTEDS